MKTRVLWVSEASVLNTGYAVYSREILRRLFKKPDLYIAEFAAYLNSGDSRVREIPWRVYPNLPDSNNQDEVNKYLSEPTNQFGAWKFEQVVHDFLPHIVIGISDFWMQSFIGTSPYRSYYQWFWMPTVDAEHQEKEWLSAYRDVDKLFTYQDWSIEVLKSESNNQISVVGSAPPCADEAFYPFENRESIKKSFGLEGFTIFGTVMRNQRRKLYPSLFKTFRKYLDQSQNNRALLYCHTSYPDRGWDIPGLLLEYGLSNKVLFTYVCKKCGHSFPSFFSDAITYCNNCNTPSACCANVHHGVDNKTLALIYNMLDVYIQYSNCLAPGQQILTKTGWKNIENVQSGESVYTHNGQQEIVIRTFSRPHNGNINEISVSGSYEILKITNEHPLYIIDKESLGYNKQNISLREFLGKKIKASNIKIPHRFTEVKDLQEGDMLVEKIDTTEQDVYSIDLAYLAKQTLQPDQYIYNETRVSLRRSDIYPRYIKIDNDFCMFLGLYLADGTSTKSGVSICSHINESSNIQLATNVLTILTNKQPTIRKYKNSQAVDIIGNSLLLQLLFKQYNKLENKHLPDWALTLPISKQKSVVQGMFMGDGHYLADKNVSIYVTISHTLSQQLEYMLKRIGLTFSVNKITKRSNRKPQYRFEVRGDVKNGEFDTSIQSTCSLNYNGYYYRKITKINKTPYNGLVYNCEVENDNSYLTRIGIAHNCEGFGMPIVEAAACATPIAAVNYSAMTDILNKLGGHSIEIIGKEPEVETGRLMAVPNEQSLLNVFELFSKMSEEEKRNVGNKIRKNYLQYYNWDRTADIWYTEISKLNPQILDKLWYTKPNIQESATQIPQDISNEQFARFLILYVLKCPKYCNSHMEARLIRDLNYGVTTNHVGGLYFNEMSQLFSGQNHQKAFNRRDAYEMMIKIRQKINYWENLRAQKLGLRNE